MATLSSAQITVAVPTCNGATYLRETLLSILSQEGAAVELIISDDRSDDETLELVRATVGDRAKIVVNSERLGLAGNWNRCVEVCPTPFIAIIHQDDVLYPGHLAAHLAAFAADPRVGLVASNWKTIDMQGREIPDPARRENLGPLDRVLSPGALAEHVVRCDNPLRCSGVSIRTDAHADVGGFGQQYRYLLDCDFWVRVSRNWKLAWLATPTTKVRCHDLAETHRLITKHHDDLTLFNESKSLILKLLNEDLARHPRLARFRRDANLRLARDLLNRSQHALWLGQVKLAHSCLVKSIRLSPRILGPVLSNYRLAIKSGILALVPGLAGRLFSQAYDGGGTELVEQKCDEPRRPQSERVGTTHVKRTESYRNER